MAEYYLPIKIGQRRMHICHLEKNPSNDSVFEFIIPIAGNDIELFSLSHNAKLVSGKGTKFNKELKTQKYKVEHTQEQETINLKITVGETGEVKDTPLNDSSLAISLKRDSKDNFIAKATNHISIKKLNIIFSYKEKNGDSLEYSFIIHTPKENNETKVYKAAIDFGSEASQVGFKDNSGNGNSQFIPLVDTLKDFYNQHNGHNNFWQGKSNETDPETSRLFKSVFFVNKNPSNGYDYADIPNKYNEKTILQTITPRTTIYTDQDTKNLYDSLFLLPNLKLVELLADRHFLNDDIAFTSSENNPRSYNGKQGVLSNELVEDFIRLILNHLLYAILSRIKTETRSKKYLHVTLLMPNVYSQKKVYDLIRNLYKDFNSIIQTTEYQSFQGIEVQAMSESDASFIGARSKSNTSIDVSNRISNQTHANYLVIDAGRGTTDFSVIKQQESFVKYDSQFRTGLPGSGQMLSYAFIEAINEMFTNTDLNELIKAEKDYPEILQFMDYVEQLKTNHAQFKEPESIVNEEKFSKLSKINEYIKTEFIDTKKRIPNSNNKVCQKVTELIDRIEENIRYSEIESFHQVILAGRAFRFEPLLEAVKSKFENLVKADNKFIFQNSESKFICIEGAFQGGNIHINLNSELIGSPVILDKDYKPFSPNISWVRKLIGGGKKDNFIDENFFYDGIKLNYHLKDKYLRIGARDYSPTANAREKTSYILFYTGDGFVLQWQDGAEFLTEGNISQSFTSMVKETLFPFAEISFGNNTTSPKIQTQSPKIINGNETEKKVEKTTQDSVTKPDNDDPLS